MSCSRCWKYQKKEESPKKQLISYPIHSVHISNKITEPRFISISPLHYYPFTDKITKLPEKP